MERINMSGLTFDRNSFFIDNERVYLNSGEFHYFRVPIADWKQRMQLLKATGANCLATYLPWLIHEPTEGTFRIDAGDGVTDVRRFLDCAAEAGLMVIARPGPYQYSELNYCGLPGWLCRNYPEMAARNRKGDIFCEFSMSYLHPGFLQKVRRYFARICPIIADYSVSRGGPIVLAQPDNEAGGVHAWFGDLDFNPVTMGFGSPEGRYAVFLQNRYGNVERLNELYRTNHLNFMEFVPADEPLSGTERLRWNRDYFDFYTGTISEYLSCLMDMMTEFGVDVPFCHNAASPNMVPWFREAAEQSGGRLLIGSDNYYNLDQNWAQNNPTPQYAIRCLLGGKLLESMGYPFCVMEFPTGNPSDWPPMTPVDMEAALRLHAALGMRGHNGYIFTGGSNVPDTGVTGTTYDYNAPVGADGTIRPTYEVLKRYGEFIAANPELTSSSCEADFQLYIPWHMMRSSAAWGAPADLRAANPGELYEEIRRGLVTTAVVAGLDFRLSDPEKEPPEPALPLIAVCDGAMTETVQRRLTDFVRQGGRLLVMPIMPFMDEKLCPCTILSDFLNGAGSAPEAGLKSKNLRQFVVFEIGEINDIWGNGRYYPAMGLPPGAEITGREKLGNTVAAWHWERKEGGAVAFLGFSWCHAMREHTKMLEFILGRLGIVAKIGSDNEWVLVRRRRESGSWRIFAANLGSSKQSVRLRYYDPSSDTWTQLDRLDLVPMQVADVRIEISKT